jgi:hypothetical protein
MAKFVDEDLTIPTPMDVTLFCWRHPDPVIESLTEEELEWLLNLKEKDVETIVKFWKLLNHYYMEVRQIYRSPGRLPFCRNHCPSQYSLEYNVTARPIEDCIVTMQLRENYCIICRRSLYKFCKVYERFQINEQ